MGDSPQAKRRVERNHGTQPDRLIQKLRLQRIGTTLRIFQKSFDTWCKLSLTRRDGWT